MAILQNRTARRSGGEVLRRLPSEPLGVSQNASGVWDDLIGAFPLAVLAMDSRGIVRAMNTAAEELLGLRWDSTRPRSFATLFASAQEGHDFLKRLRAERRVGLHPATLRSASGTGIPVLIDARQGDKPDQFACVLRRLNDAGAPGALDILRGLGGWVWESDACREHLHALAPGDTVLGYPASEWTQPGAWHERVHEEDRIGVLSLLARAARDGTPVELEYRVQTAFGSLAYVREWARPNGPTIRSTCIDVTERKRLERDVLEIAERERNRIGQDLHDDLCQHLAGLACLTRILECRLREAGRGEADAASDITAQLQQAMRKARAVAAGLYPASLQTEGLTCALQELAAQATSQHDVSVRLRAAKHFPPVSGQTAIHLYRITQEALNNALRHGHAKQVDVILGTRNRCGVLSVRDDGTGFPPDKLSGRAGGMGLHTMRYRASAIGGTLRIHNNRVRGSTVSCVYPLTPFGHEAT